jgi:hypothetical protein
MRANGFLRTPIRGDHQARLQNLRGTEVPLAGNPASGTPYPQALEISFDVQQGTTEIQISPVLEGTLLFIPDSTSNNPTDPAQVVEASYPGWSVTGDLLLRAVGVFGGSNELAAVFSQHIPLIAPPPDTFRYSKIRITRDFLFTTVRRLRATGLVFNATAVDSRDPLYHPKLVISFLQGRARVMCRVDPAAPANDDALQPMPAVVLAPAGNRRRCA